MPSVSLPSCMPRVTMPTSRIEAASEPENGPVSAKQGISSPRASRGRKCCLLRVGAVFLDQLAGAERVRHHDDGDAVGAARGDLAEDQRLRLGGEAEAAMLLGDEHAEEAVVADELPDVVGHVVQLVADAPIVEPLAELVGRPVEKGALLGGERDRRDAAELRPVGLAGEQLGVPADGAGLERLALGVGDGRHRAFQRAIGGQRDVFALDLGEARARTAARRRASQAATRAGNAANADGHARGPSARSG